MLRGKIHSRLSDWGLAGANKTCKASKTLDKLAGHDMPCIPIAINLNWR
jgi:hypothetical protein